MKSKFWHLIVFLALIVSMLPATVAAVPAEPEASPQAATPVKTPQDMTPQLGAAPKPGAGIESLSGSTVTFDPSVGGDTCSIPGASQTFCFNAHSLTNDWEYVYNVWVKFPADWTVTNVYVQGTPACTGGGTWGDFSWSFQTSPNEVNISHARYQQPTDDCTAYYCFEVLSGVGAPDSLESWYWDGDGYGSTPHNPCSSDNYTPAGQSACDEYVNPQAVIPACAVDPGVYLLPPTQEASGCNGLPQEHTLSLYNNTGSDAAFAMSYSVPSGNGALTGPGSVTANQGQSVPFTVILTPDLCTQPGAVVVAQIDASGSGYANSAVISKTVETEPGWETIPASAPTWPGYGYPRDGCTALNAAGDWVTYLIGDMSSYTGFWGYNHATNTWFQPNPTNTPADRWAPDWAYDPDTNLCYVTGGANTPGGGTYNDAYVFDPVANSFTALGAFTSIRDFHNSWVGTIDAVKYLCIGGGVNASSVLVQSTQCYDLAQTAPGVWNAENAQMAAYPTDPFGAADGVLHAPGGDQFWYVGGAINNFATVTDEARYWDDADNAWHTAGNTGVPRYRVEGDFFNGDFYQLGGSSGGFTPTADVVRGAFDGVGWTWTAMPAMNNIRMDNVVALAEGTIWSVDGYGDAPSDYVEKLAFCPICDLQGWLEGTVLDGDTQPVVAAASLPLVGWKPAAPVPPEGGWLPAPAADLAGATAPQATAPAAAFGATWKMPDAVLYDNGPLVTHPADCTGVDASRLQNISLAMNTYGFGHALSTGYRMADDFTITDPGGWQIDQITFFAYQTDSPTNPSPINHVNYQIWDGPPGQAGSSVVFGDTTTNRLVSSTWAAIYRDYETTTCGTTRPIMADVASAGVFLPPGTYWLDWQTGGTLSSGPWAPPITILGQTTTGNGLQYSPTTGLWSPALDSGTSTQQGMPFIIEGTSGGTVLGPACTNAVVTINPGNIHVAVDPATGHYGPVMLIQGDYTVEATAPGYSVETATVTIVDELTTTQDFVLWRPVIDVDPMDPISVQSPPSVPVTIPLTIANLGHLPLDWEFVEVPGSAALNATLKTPAGAYRQPVAATGLDPFILEQIAQSSDGKADVFVAFKDTADLTGAYDLTAKADKIQFVRTALRQAADKAQAGVRSWLDAQGIDYQVFNIDNTLLIRADRATIDALAEFPEVSGFHGNHTYEILPTDMPAAPEAGTDAIIPWDLTIMNIPQVWDELGITGEGVIVANVDTGVDYDHEALLPNYLCDGGPHTDCWLDPDGGTTTPNDGNGHGTGTMSQMAADNDPAFQYAVGGAPDAGWIACLGCPGGSCPDSALNACADWLVLTTPHTPDIVNNSWGTWSALCDPWYDGKIAAYRAAGVVPVWAAGNIGNACNTSTPPANSIGTLAVGATTSSDVQASFSSTGPGLCTGRTQFPDVAAPGDGTCAAVTGGGYACSFGGTSFAAPRAAGCLALMKSAAPYLGVQDLMDALMATADDKLNTDCGSPQDDPNYRYGDGRVNCFEAVSAVYNADLDWVWEIPVSGTIPPLDVQPVDVVLHCEPEQEGLILTGTLRINHNDPCAAPINIPVELICGEPTDPDIEVVPPALSTIQLQDEQVVQTLNINNHGTTPLDWTIIEHNPGLAMAPTAPNAKASRPVELKLEAAGGASVETNPPVIDAPVSLILDDGTRDNDIGIGGTWEFIWVNRFTPAAGEFPFNLTQVQIYFSSVGLVNVGDDIIIVVYENTSGNADPAVGSNWLASFPTTVQAVDAWNVYDLATPVALNGPGDVIIGAIALEIPGTSYWPASIDQTTTQQRSWAGWWLSSPPPTPPTLPPDDTWILIDDYFPGNWMVRGYGETIEIPPPPECEPIDIPWATVDPISGTTGGHGTFPVDVTFDSTGMAAGTYTANLCVESNDPDEPYVIVPLTMTVLALQNIEVTPSSLTQELCPDATATQQLTICNTGDLDLEWTLIEISETVKTSSPFVPVNVKGNGKEAPISAASPAQPLVKPAPAANPEDVLWDQPLSTVNQNAYVNQDFPDFPDYSSFLADDFVNADNWYIDTIFVPGNGWNGFSTLLNADSLTWQIYADDGTGFPDGDPAGGGNAPLWTLTLAPTDPMVVITNGSGGMPSDTTLNLTSPVTVPPGHWWLVFYPTLSFGSYGQHGRQPADTTNGYVGKFINPGGGFGYGTVWQDWTVLGITQPDIAFRIEGSAVPPFDAPWVSEDPTSGTIPGGDCTVVDVTFDSTGLTPGDYYTWFLITSNDPDTPEVTIPVQLTVLEAVAIADVTYTIDGLEVTFDATVTGSAPFTFAWDFGDGYTSNLEDPVHIYADAGCYSVTLTVSNLCGDDTWDGDICVESPYLYYYLPIISRGYPVP